jgi:hypothetical protein
MRGHKDVAEKAIDCGGIAVQRKKEAATACWNRFSLPSGVNLYAAKYSERA